MLTAKTFHPRDLTAAQTENWRALAATHPDFASPLLAPGFAQAVGAVRDDARVTLWKRDGGIVGVLAYHLRPGAYARPIGAPLSDYHALIAEPGLDGAEALAVAGLAAYRFTGLVDPHGLFAAGGQVDGYAIDIHGDAEGYLEALRAASPKRFKNYRRLDHKLSREVGEVSLRPASDPADFALMLAWKRDQIVRTGVHDFLAPQWIERLLASLFETRTGDFQGLMLGLYAGERLIAAHFGVRQGGVYHPWIAANDPAMAEWSPGQIFLSRAIAAMPALGLATYDLGLGHDHYKRPFVRTPRVLGEGVATTGRRAALAERAWTLAGARGEGPVGRLRRRLDVIAAVELSLADRARGLALALARGGRDRAEAA